MSVLKAHRSESRAEYVNTANKIYVQTINFLSRLSSRYSRLVAESVAELASDVVDNAEKANSIYPSDETRKELRKRHLLESRAALMALDVHLAHCYELMMLNPAGCFMKSNGDIRIDDERNADAHRVQILRFNRELLQDNIPHTQEDFIEALSEIDFYERYCREHPEYENNRAVLAIQNIERVYSERLEKHDFGNA